MRIVFTGGGTGGHILPNIAVIRELEREKRKLNINIFYIGGKNSLEEKMIHEERIHFYGIHVGKLRRYWDLKNLLDVFKVPLGLFEAWRLLGNIRPNLVFAKGGYVSVPVALAAWLRGVPLWLHESDVTPGLSTKICARFAQKLWLSFKQSEVFFPSENTEVVGNPIRRDILIGDPALGYAYTGFSKELPVVLIIGGSSGALHINKLVYKILPELLQQTQVIHVTGGEHISRFMNSSRYFSIPFLHRELADCYAMAQLVVSRAGSGSLFEVLAIHKPLLLIPLPKSASRGDQVENADAFERSGFAETLDQDTLTSHVLLDAIQSILQDSKLRHSMIEHQKKVNFSDAARKIAVAMLQLQQASPRS